MLERFAIYLESYLRNNTSNNKRMQNFYSGKLVKRYLGPYLLLKLRKTMRYAYKNSQFYHEMFKTIDMTPKNIKTYDDFERIPLTTSLDILNVEKFFCVPKEKFVKTFKSSGTTGKPKKVYLTQKDVSQQISRNVAGMRLFSGINEHDILRILHGPRYAEFFCASNAADKIGAKISYTKKRLTVEEEFNQLVKNNITAILSNPSFFHSLSIEMSSKYDLSDLRIKTIMLGAAPLSETSRQKIEKIWNADVLQAYGLNEVGVSVAGECKEKNGLHVAETDFYVEVIDPQTGKKLEDGGVGELVFSTIDREGMPLLRYRSNDLGLIVPGSCKCGSPFKRIKILGRIDDMVLLGFGENLYPREVSDVVLNIRNVVDYQLILGRRNNKDYLTAVVETTQQKNSDKLKKEVKEALMSIGQIRRSVLDAKMLEISKIKLVKPTTSSRQGIKAKRIIDNRNLYSAKVE